MRRLLLSSLLLIGIAISGINGQQCNADLPSECYYTGAGTISAGSSAQAHQYFVIGGLFDVHDGHDDNAFCKTQLSIPGMTNLMAFFWSVDKFGSNKFAGKQMTAGALAFDNCMRPDQTVSNMLSFSQCKVRVQGINQDNVVAYVGPYSNMDASRTTMLATDLKITLVSPAANALSFGGGDMYKNLLRLRPNLMYDIKAINAFLKHKNSPIVMVVYSEETEKEYEMMQMDGNVQNNVCHQPFKLTAMNQAEIDRVADLLKESNDGKFVVPLLPKTWTKALMQATFVLGDRSLTYILNSDIGRDKDFVTANAIIVEQEPVTNYLDDLLEFNTYLTKINSNETLYGNFERLGVANPWLNEWISQGKKFPNLMAADPSPMYMNVLRTIQSVNLIINGFDQAVLRRCVRGVAQNNYQFCDELRNEEDKLFTDIKGSMFGNDGEMISDNIVYNYYIYKVGNLQNENFEKIGNFMVATNKVELDDTNAALVGVSLTATCPDSLSCCIPPTMPPTDSPTVRDTTEAVEVTPDSSNYVEVKYPIGKEITGAFSDRHRPDEEYGTRFDLNQKWIIALGVLAGLGIVCVFVFEIYILFKMIGKKVDNKWRTMWLGQLLLFGIFLSYLTCIAYLFIPTKATCGITRFGVGVSYAICFAVLLVKLMVILTSKTSEVLMPGDMDSPNYLKGVYQFLMFVFAVGVQVVINVQWLITVPPEAIKVLSNSGDQVWVCNHFTWKATHLDILDMANFVRTNFDNHVISLTYIMVLIVIITILSLNAHGIITNHRESVFIGIAAGFSIPIWLAWGLVGGLNKESDFGHEFGDACMAFGLFLTATLILFAMFLPKVRQLVNMGVEGIYLEDDRDTIYGGSIIMAPPSYKSKGGPASVIYVNNQGIYSEPVVLNNGDTLATHLKHPMSTYSAPPTYLKKTESTYGGSRVLRVTDDLKGRHPNNRSTKKPVSEVNYGTSGRPRSLKGTLPRSRSQSDLGAL